MVRAQNEGQAHTSGNCIQLSGNWLKAALQPQQLLTHRNAFQSSYEGPLTYWFRMSVTKYAWKMPQNVPGCNPLARNKSKRKTLEPEMCHPCTYHPTLH